jgi:transcriptional regulator with XRE-family HTH domain
MTAPLVKNKLPPGTTLQDDTKPAGPDPVDLHVGKRLRLRRNLLGFSQEQLGKATGLTFQQIQKYERGANRISASRLFQMAQILDVPVAWFFDELPEESAASRRPGFSDNKQTPLEGGPGAPDQILHRRETAELLRAWYRVTDPKQRRRILDLIKSMGETGS